MYNVNKINLVAIAAALMSLANCGSPDPEVGPRGYTGKQGNRGHTGAPGTPGTGCSVQQVLPGDLVLPYGGAVITCGSSTTVVSNGAPGADGVSPPTALAVQQVIDPCGKQSSFDEVFLLFGNGSLVASFSNNANGDMTRLSNITPNLNSSASYMTTDNTNCSVNIAVDANGEASLTTGNGQGQASWHID